MPRLIAPDFTDTQAIPGRPATPPYPVPAAVALALNDALGLGLLTNEVWSSWPAARDGRPLSRIWEGILKSGGLS
ncbi:hypothetical protein [Deinococcus sp. QL22]|uniref:hypothetical protein n=1 Tax=Deinococcus sp. QL22 TaxID=2939437 RepID=UPI002017A7E1|nr:hypothetical protein [Deinococcus sp. QL22]UQN06761.1 hypothetical protein M1R55_02230 [Deinococcus sp. QL22]